MISLHQDFQLRKVLFDQITYDPKHEVKLTGKIETMISKYSETTKLSDTEKSEA